MLPMQRRAFIARLIALAAAPAFLAGCPSARRLAVGIHPWIGYEPLYLAREFGWLPPGVDLQEGRMAGDSLAALRDGRLDAAALTLDEVLLARAAGVPLTVVAVFDISAGADVVLARPTIKGLADLAGRRIGIERSALGALMLAKLLEAGKLDAKAVQVVDLPPHQQLQGWRDGSVDAVVSYEPTASLLRREGAIRLFDSRRIPETIFDVLAVRRDRTDGQERSIREMLAAHFKALNYLVVNRQDSIYRIAAREGVQADEVKQALAGITLPDLWGNRNYLDPESRLIQVAAALNQLMLEQGLLPRPDKLDGLLDARYLPRAASTR